MIATFISLSVFKGSMFPRLQFNIDLLNNEDNQILLVYGWTGELYLRKPEHVRIGDLSPKFNFQSLDAKASTKISAYCEMGYDKLDIIEDLRKGTNLGIAINLELMYALIQKAAQLPHDIQKIRCDDLWVKSSTGEEIIWIPRSQWDDTLEELNYSNIVTLRLPFPPPPVGTQLDKSIGYLKDAQNKINDGEWSDSLVSCRKAIDELQNICDNDDEKRKAFFESMLSDGKKAEACEDLWRSVQKAKNFASGGPHTYWIKTADKRDAELAIRVVSAFVHYFAHNLSRASAS